MNYQHLSKSQRYEIKVYLNCNKSQKFIAEQLSVSQSCISRELNRNKIKRGGYDPEKAFISTTELYLEGRSQLRLIRKPKK
jgi:IS30 family transposase